LIYYVAKNTTLNAFKKNCDYVFLIFFNCYLSNISGVLYYILTYFGPTNRILLTVIKKKKIENWYSQNKSKYFELFWCLANANIIFQWKLYVSAVICFRVTPKTKIDFVENLIIKISVFPGAFKNYCEF